MRGSDGGGEPNDVRVKLAVREDLSYHQGRQLTALPFKTQSPAESFADGQRARLGLAAKPPIDER